MSNSDASLAQNQRFRVAAPKCGAASSQSEVAVKVFAPVVNSVELKFTVCLESASFLFDGKQKPTGKNAGLMPSHAIAGWAHCIMDEKTCNIKPHKEIMFRCDQAANVRSAGGAEHDYHLVAEWSSSVGTSSSAEFKKTMRQKEVGEGFEDQCIQITLYAANQKPPDKDGSLKAPTKTFKLDGPFFINVSVSSRQAIALFCPVFVEHFDIPSLNTGNCSHKF